LKIAPDHACVSHADTELGAPERSMLVAAEPAPVCLRPFQTADSRTRASRVDDTRPPPLDRQAATPLRI
jgi:hypothetical protein